ncbi:exonuclease SbcC [Cryobacterium psychrotolerans]|uniref:Nuclease SbcCD subunit C n=1 Tax=Cryobacterium psychrotolerans TaxID=386301 RepID=A0A1G8X6J4_9MICO|nr:AAA family ATPase [Cryobacterium psychrotolerans]TFD83013.1 hypothetical protein E3T56_14880 [Cryobacterium psychrotolerans]SDJ86163.1 exonuclease SbcC [Cryobacterium psychrotolerans]
MNPRLKSLKVKNFRSIRGEWTIPLDGSIVLLHGNNGAGKTSILSAIELAATGTISHLRDSGDESYAKHILHRGSRDGSVSLAVSNSTNRIGVSSTLSLSTRGPDGQPLLDEHLGRHFAERCLLSQATLGRLLDVYAPPDQKRQESALINFVKELLGIDRLDDLISGLHSTIRVDYAQKKSRVWTAALAERKRVAEGHANQKLRLIALDKDLGQLRAVLRERMASTVPGDASDKELSRCASRELREAEQNESELAALTNLDAMLRIATSISEAVGGPDLELMDSTFNELELDVVSARRLLNTLWSEIDGPINSYAKTANSLLEVEAEWRREHARNDLDRMTNHARQFLERLDEEIQNAQDMQSRLRRRRDTLHDRISIGNQLRELRDDLGATLISGQLTEALALILPNVSGPNCPVCDQGFESGAEGLQEHIQSKLEELHLETEAWSTADVRLRDCETEIAQISLEISRLEAQAEEPHVAGSRHSLRKAVSVLIQEYPPIEALLDDVKVQSSALAALEEQLDAAISKRARSRELVSQIKTIETELAVGHPQSDQSNAERIEFLREKLTLRRTQSETLRRTASRLRSTLKEFETAVEESTELRISVERDQKRLDGMDAQLGEAKHRKDLASDLRVRAEEERSRVINSVFDQRLNGTWRKLFSRLVPDEPFLPQFDRQIKSERSISVNLTTQDRQGQSAGTPSAMLSHGNLNTAALSLFLSLHFVAPNELPWLILDDPVQSMDDIHIANFAALLKHMSREQGRQVVVAVHQRELFDYLALELTPAAPGQDLITVEIDRSSSDTTITTRKREFQPDSALDRHAA